MIIFTLEFAFSFIVEGRSTIFVDIVINASEQDRLVLADNNNPSTPLFERSACQSITSMSANSCGGCTTTATSEFSEYSGVVMGICAGFYHRKIMNIM